jgi:hypothetical protein
MNTINFDSKAQLAQPFGSDEPEKNPLQPLVPKFEEAQGVSFKSEDSLLLAPEAETSMDTGHSLLSKEDDGDGEDGGVQFAYDANMMDYDVWTGPGQEEEKDITDIFKSTLSEANKLEVGSSTYGTGIPIQGFTNMREQVSSPALGSSVEEPLGWSSGYNPVALEFEQFNPTQISVIQSE